MDGMKTRTRNVTRSLVVSLLIALGAAGGATSASAVPNTVNKICAYEYQGRCVKWYTGTSTCYHIYETNQPEYRKKACAVWAATGHMYVEG